MPEENWYYAQGGERHGPAPFSELQALAMSGGLKSQDLVWSEGMEAWTPAASVPGLATMVPPPLPDVASKPRRLPWKPIAVVAVVTVVILGIFMRQRLFSPSIEALLGVVPEDTRSLVVLRGLPGLAVDLGLLGGGEGAMITALSDLAGLGDLELSDRDSILATGLDITAPLGMSVHQPDGTLTAYYLPIGQKERLHATLERFAESRGWQIESRDLKGKALLSADSDRFGAVEYRGHLVVARSTGLGEVIPFLETLVGGRAGSVEEADWFKSMQPLTEGDWHLLGLTDPTLASASGLSWDPWGARASELAGLGGRLEISDNAIRLRYQEVSREGVEHGLSGLVGPREDRFASRVAGEALGALRLSVDLSSSAAISSTQGTDDWLNQLDLFKEAFRLQGDNDPTAYLGSPISMAVLKGDPEAEMPVDVVAWAPLRSEQNLETKLEEFARSMGRDGIRVTTEEKDGTLWYTPQNNSGLSWAIAHEHLVVAFQSSENKIVTDSGDSFLASLERAEQRQDLASRHDMAFYVDLEAFSNVLDFTKDLPEADRAFLDNLGDVAVWVDAGSRELVSEWTFYPRQSGGFAHLAAGLEEEQNLSIPGLDRSRQKKTLLDMRSMGTAYLSWLTDQVGAASAGKGKIYLGTNNSKRLSRDEVKADLRPSDKFFYMDDIPWKDGWGHPIEVWRGENYLHSRVILIRSPGRDGVFEGEEYTAGTFSATDYDRDIVWVDGYFIQYPDGYGRH